MVNHLVHEVAVVADNNHAALEIAQILLEHLQGLNVKVICRLVEHKKIGVRHEHRAQVETAFLATTQFIYITVLLFGREEEVLQELRCCEHLAGNGNHLGNILHNIYHLHLLVKGKAILAVIAPFHRLAHLYYSIVGGNAAKQHLYECRFTRAVVANNSQFLVACKCVVEILCNDPVAESLGQCLHDKYLVADILRLHLERHLALVAHGSRLLL